MTPQEYEKAKAQIEHIAKECANDNWGGQRSVSITPKSIEAAKELLNRIHDTAMPPIITPLLDAIIEFSWECGHPDINNPGRLTTSRRSSKVVEFAGSTDIARSA